MPGRSRVIRKLMPSFSSSPCRHIHHELWPTQIKIQCSTLPTLASRTYLNLACLADANDPKVHPGMLDNGTAGEEKRIEFNWRIHNFRPLRVRFVSQDQPFRLSSERTIKYVRLSGICRAQLEIKQGTRSVCTILTDWMMDGCDLR